MKKKLALLLVLALLVMTVSGCSGEKDAAYPNKSVQFIVPWSPGGGSDTAMRIVAKHLETQLGQPVIVVNKPGVSGTLGLMELTESQADGYTIGMIHEGLVVAHHAGVTELNYDSFIPISNMSDTPQWIAANIDAPFDTLDEFIEYSQANPGEVKFGMTLQGVAHAWGAVMGEEMGAEFNLVPYEGTGARMQALAGGFIDITVADYSSVIQFVENGDLKLIAYCGEERSELTSDLPTLVEKGVDLVASVRRGIVVPKETPQEIIDILQTALEETAKDEAFISDLDNMGIGTLYLNQDNYNSYLDKLNTNTEKIADQLK